MKGNKLLIILALTIALVAIAITVEVKNIKINTDFVLGGVLLLVLIAFILYKKRVQLKRIYEILASDKNRVYVLVAMLLSVIAIVVKISTNIEVSLTDTETEKITTEQETPKMADIKIATTIYPIYDFIREVRGTDKNIILLDKNNIDANELKACDLILYMDDNGYDSWLKVTLNRINLGDSDKLVKLSTILGDYKDYGWVSIENAISIVNYIGLLLAERDLEFSVYYSSNAQAYINKLDKLRTEYYSIISAGLTDTVYFNSEEERLKIANLLEEIQLKTAVDEAGEHSDKIVQFKDTHDIGEADPREAKSYLSIMKENAKILEKALQ